MTPEKIKFSSAKKERRPLLFILLLLLCSLATAQTVEKRGTLAAANTDPAENNLELIIIAFPDSGWYQVSLPVVAENDSVRTLFPTVTGAFSWENDHYEAADTMATGRGYFLFVPAPATAFISGTTVTQFSGHFTPGWHNLGSVIDTVDFFDPNDTPDGSILLPAFSWFGFQPRYNPPVTVIEQSFGHWIAVLQETDLTIESNPAPNPDRQISLAELRAHYDRAGLSALFQRDAETMAKIPRRSMSFIQLRRMSFPQREKTNVSSEKLSQLAQLSGLGQARLIQAQWTVPMTVALAGLGQDLIAFGAVPGATNGLDPGIDLLNPPAPPTVFDAFFQIAHPLFPNLTEDFRADTITAATWNLSIVETNGAGGTIAWDASGFTIPNSRLEIRQGNTVLADMLAVDSLNFTGDQNLSIVLFSGEPDIAVTPDSLDFGNVPVGSSDTLTVVVSNGGTADLEVTVSDLTGTDAGEFSIISGAAPFALSPGDNQDVMVSFNPNSAGLKRASLRFISNDPDNDTLNVALSGTGVSTGDGLVAWYKFEGNAADSSDNGNHGTFNGNPQSVLGIKGNALLFNGKSDFVQVPSSSTLNFTTELTITGWICPAGTDGGLIVVLTKGNTRNNNTPYNVVYRQRASIVPFARFTSINNQIFTRDLNEIPNSLELNQWNFFAWRFSNGVLAIFKNGNKLGEVNTGFSILRQDNLPLEIGRDVPGSTEFFLGILDEIRIYNRAVSDAEIQELFFETSVPDIIVKPTSHDFGEVLINASASLSVLVQNKGTAALEVTATEIIDNVHFSIQSGSAPFTIAPGDTHEIVVTFAPNSAGVKFDTLRIISNDPDENPLEVPLTGNGIGMPDIAVNPDSLDFGNVTIGSNVVRTVIVSNDGSADLEVSSTGITGLDAGAFSIVSGGAPFVLSSGDSQNVVVSFNPISDGAKTAVLEIVSNDPDENPFAVPLIGTGEERPCPVTSFFDIDAEGWMVVGDAQGGTGVPDYIPTGGNPGGYISARDNVTGGVWYWQAPSKFLGEVANAYAQTLAFDLRQSSLASQFDAADVTLDGAGLTLVFDTPNNPGRDWTPYSIPLVETAGWKKNTLTGPAPTQTEMQAVLSSLTGLRIRGEFVSGADRGDLDNVVLNCQTIDALSCEVDITSPSDGAFVCADSITVEGVTRIMGGRPPFTIACDVNGVPAPHTTTGFMLNLRCVPGNNILIATCKVTDADNRVATGVDTINVICPAPLVSKVDLTAPADSVLICDKAVKVTAVTSITGGVPPFTTTCDVNGAAATVAGNTLTAIVSLAPGWNSLIAACTVTDSCGKTVVSSDTIRVRSIDDKIAPTSTITPGYKSVTGTVFDDESGIATIEPVFLFNAKLTVDPFVPGAKSVNFRVDDLGLEPYLGFDIKITDLCGNSHICDPVLSNLAVDASRHYTFNFRSVDRYLILENHGLSEIRVDLNGHLFNLSTASSSNVRNRNTYVIPEEGSLTIDLKPYLLESENVMRLEIEGRAGSGADFTLIDATHIIDHTLELQPIPMTFELSQNYPNPFNPSTTIRFGVPAHVVEGAAVQLRIYSTLGELVRTLVDEKMFPGQYAVEWNGKNDRGETVATGIYIYQLVTGGFKQTKKMSFLK